MTKNGKDTISLSDIEERKKTLESNRCSCSDPKTR